MERIQQGTERMKLDLVYLLTGSVKVDKGFNYIRQRDYYLNLIFPDVNDAKEVIEYGKRFKRFSEYMFPNNPGNIRNKKLLAEVLAECALLKQIRRAENAAAISDETRICAACFDECQIVNADFEADFIHDVKHRYILYVHDLTDEQITAFKALMQKFEEPFEKIFGSLKAMLCKKQPVNILPVVSSFSAVCKKLGVLPEDELLFRLKLDALAEMQIGNNTHVDFFDSLKDDWREKFPHYPYCEEIETYIRHEKVGCIVIYGNKLAGLRKESILFDLLPAVNIKLLLIEGISNPDALYNALEQKFDKIPHADLHKRISERKKKIAEYYGLNHAQNYSDALKTELTPYRTALSYVDELLTEEIFRRYKIITQQADALNARELERKYTLLLTQKDDEIAALKQDLEYYENINSQAARNDFSKYSEVLTNLFGRLCDYKFGAPLGELYLLADSKADIKPEALKTIMKNFLFVFNSLGVTPCETKNLGKTLQFDSEDANIVYAVNEKNLVDGLNSGTLKYPGWKYGEKKIVLPFVITDKEEF